MFKKLTEFGYQRNAWEALGFYLAYLLLVFIVGALIGALIYTLYGAGPDSVEAMHMTRVVGSIFGVIFVLGLSFVVLYKKGLINNFSFVILGVVSGLLAVAGGGLLGLILVSYFTTRENV